MPAKSERRTYQRVTRRNGQGAGRAPIGKFQTSPQRADNGTLNSRTVVAAARNTRMAALPDRTDRTARDADQKQGAAKHRRRKGKSENAAGREETGVASLRFRRRPAAGKTADGRTVSREPPGKTDRSAANGASPAPKADGRDAQQQDARDGVSAPTRTASKYRLEPK